MKKVKPDIKMDDKIIKYDDIEIEEYEFHQHKSLISKNDTDIHEIVVSNKLLLDKKAKYFINYKDNFKNKLLCI